MMTVPPHHTSQFFLALEEVQTERNQTDFPKRSSSSFDESPSDDNPIDEIYLANNSMIRRFSKFSC